MTTSHQIINPDSLPRPSGYSHAVIAAPGRTVYLAGQTAQGPDGAVVGSTMAEQYGQAAKNVVAALAACGGRPEQLVSMQIFVTDVAAYKRELREIGAAHRASFGMHFPATALFEIKGLFDPTATIELMCIAVIPEE